jgi:uncharacterized membrane protein (UPF0127 family)
MMVLAAITSCTTESWELSINEHQFTVEIADTPEARQRGLMERRTLASDAGMLFVFPSSELRSFWMKDTLLPLSIAYIDSNLVIREIYQMDPLSLVPVPSRFPARFALEVNEGVFEELGIRPGDRIELSRPLQQRLERSPAE